MKKEVKIHEFHAVIYPYRIWVVINRNVGVIKEHFNDYDCNPIETLEKDTDQLEAFAMQVVKKDTKKLGTVLFFRNKASMNFDLVAHESVHAAKHLFERISADITPAEPFEYLVGWIAGCCDVARKFNDKKPVL